MKKLYVGNLPYSIDSKGLEELFAEFGEVISAIVITDRETGRSKGFGFVEMDDEAADKAEKELSGKEIDGRMLKISEARPQEKRPTTFKNY